MKNVKLFAVKNPKGKIDGNSVCDTKIGAIFAAATFDHDDPVGTGGIYDIVWLNGCTDNDAIRKRVTRAGYKIVPVKVTEIKG